MVYYCRAKVTSQRKEDNPIQNRITNVKNTTKEAQYIFFSIMEEMQHNWIVLRIVVEIIIQN